MPQRQNGNEGLGPAERIIETLLAHSDHMVHNRPGFVEPDAKAVTGVRWTFATYKAEEGQNLPVVYKRFKGKPDARQGDLWKDGTVRQDRTKVGEYRNPGIYPEVATWMYRQVAEVWKLDNKFAAQWASYAYKQDHRDLKVVLAAFMLCQSRKGDPEMEEGEVKFFDDDFRDIGEAMMLIPGMKGVKYMDPKLLLRIRGVLILDGVAAINRELGFGRSTRNPFVGRWPKAVTRWLRYREANPHLLKGLVQKGYKTSVMRLAKHVGYKPESEAFFEALGWTQKQAEDGRRGVAIGKVLEAAESWEGMSEQEICERIIKEKPGYKRITGLVPKDVGVTRAIIAAAIEAGCFSDKDLIIHMVTFEEHGLLKVQEVNDRVKAALKKADDMRAANIAKRLKNKEHKEMAEEGADNALKEAAKEVLKGLRIYFIVDISSSMGPAIEQAKGYLERFLQGFPLDKLHVSVFNTWGRELEIKDASAAGVRVAFRGIHASGGTSYAAGVKALQHHKPLPDEDALIIFVGDEEDFGGTFTRAIELSGLNPMAFGLIRVRNSALTEVQNTARELGVPCFMIDEAIFEDVYGIPRTLRRLIAATPVGERPVRAAAVPQRVTLIEQILKTDLLTKPLWAA